MELWTWQSLQFDLTSGRVDHSLSPYCLLPKVLAAYNKLFQTLGTDDQVIWCYVTRDAHKRSGDGRVEWALDVPDDQVLAVIDTWVWERIIESGAIPPQLWAKWRDEAHRNDCECIDYLSLREQEYLSQEPPAGDWWTALFLKDFSQANDATVLVAHPVCKDWVVCRPSHAH